jgi:hypothetical protein
MAVTYLVTKQFGRLRKKHQRHAKKMPWQLGARGQTQAQAVELLTSLAWMASADEAKASSNPRHRLGRGGTVDMIAGDNPWSDELRTSLRRPTRSQWDLTMERVGSG